MLQYSWKMRILFAFVPTLFYFIANLLFRTCKITVIGKENEEQFLREKKPILFVSWHQGILYYVYHFKNRNGLVMVSQSKDGELLARILKPLGFQTARGSSSRDGKLAMHTMIDAINTTQCSGGLVADAPRGPFGIAKMGIIKIAKETGLPIIPVMCWAKNKILLHNWDRTLIPLPFTHLVFYYAPPMFIGRDITPEEMEIKRVCLTEQLNHLNTEANQYFNPLPIMKGQK